jgi:DNA polymerase-3 subunit alpha
LRFWKQQHVALELIRRESLLQEELDVPASYFEDFQAKNPREINS